MIRNNSGVRSFVNNSVQTEVEDRLIRNSIAPRKDQVGLGDAAKAIGGEVHKFRQNRRIKKLEKAAKKSMISNQVPKGYRIQKRGLIRRGVGGLAGGAKGNITGSIGGGIKGGLKGGLAGTAVGGLGGAAMGLAGGPVGMLAGGLGGAAAGGALGTAAGGALGATAGGIKGGFRGMRRGGKKYKLTNT